MSKQCSISISLKADRLLVADRIPNYQLKQPRCTIAAKMLRESELPSRLSPITSPAYALRRKNSKFIVERIEGIVNPAYEPDLDGGDARETASTNHTVGQSKWQVDYLKA